MCSTTIHSISTSTPGVQEWTALNRASLCRWQKKLLPLRDRQQGPSTGQSDKWCRESLVVFSTPSVKQVSDFFMCLYQELNRRPSTIDGYRTAIIDTLGPQGSISLRVQTLQVTLQFHRELPKSSRYLPKWNLSVVLNELTKALYEPMTDLKHLTIKTAFLLALVSGKRRSEIHAWVANKYVIQANGKRLSCSPVRFS